MLSSSPIACLSFSVFIAMAAAGANAQSLDAARAVRDRAKADLIRAQEAFDRADETYIRALGGAAPASPANGLQPGAATVTVVAPTALFRSRHGRVVTFAMSGPGAEGVNPLDYRGRLVADGEPAAWTQHVSGAKNLVAPEVRTVAYEIQHNSSGDVAKPSWATICKGDVPMKDIVTVEVAISKRTECAVRQVP